MSKPPIVSEQELATIFRRTMLESIEAMESEMLAHAQVEIPVTESFVNGMYTRQIVIPAGTLLTGRVHKYDYVDLMISGDLAVATPDGGARRLKGFNVCDGKAGRKRAGYAFEDTVWITVHRTDLVEPDMEDRLTFFSLAQYGAWADRLDYLLAVEDIGIPPDIIESQVTNTCDRTDLDLTLYSVKLHPSGIDGMGLFALSAFPPGAPIMPARLDGKRTQAGRYVNHSAKPNCAMVVDGKDITLQAIRQVDRGDELTVDYRQSVEAAHAAA